MEISPPTLNLRVGPSLLKVNTTDGWVPLKNLPEKHPMVMGVDPSLSSTGVAILYNGRLKTFRLQPPKGCVGAARLGWLYTELLKIIRCYGVPAVVGIEDYAYGAKFQAHQMGELGGVYRLAFYANSIPYTAIPPTSLKAFVCDNGKADKEQVSKELFKKYGVDLVNNDEVDAAGLAIVALLRVHGVDNLLCYQKAALKNVRN